VYIDLDHMQAGHRLDLTLDVVLYLLCDLADVMTEQREKADLDLYGVLLAQLDAHALGQVLLAQKADNVARYAGIKTAHAVGLRGCKRRDRGNNVLRNANRALIALGRPVFLMIRHSAHSPLARVYHIGRKMKRENMRLSAAGLDDFDLSGAHAGLGYCYSANAVGFAFAHYGSRLVYRP